MSINKPIYKLPRKKKKAFKKRDIELYYITCALVRAGRLAKDVSRDMGNIIVSLKSIGGMVANGTELHKRLKPI